MWKKCVLGVLALAYAISLGTLAVPFATTDGLFVSPDEHATWTFAERIAETGRAQVREGRNEVLRGLLHPRSTVTIGSSIVPAGFLGMPYLTGLLFLVSPFLAASTGPLFALGGLFALYRIMRLGGASKEWSAMTVAVLAIHPAWWYYGIRSLMPNVPFVALVLCAVWAALYARQEKKAPRRLGIFFLSGALFALGIMIRPSEILWIVGIFLAGILFFKHIFSYPKEIGVWIAGAVAIGGVALLLNSAVYGHPLTTGYTVDQAVWEVGSASVSAQEIPWYTKISAFLFPFGFHEYATLRNAWQYGVELYPWMTVIGVWGMALCLTVHRKKWIREKRKILALAIAATALLYLVILYGSWTFFDNPDPSVISIGNSHVRYWLPLFVLLAPTTAYALLYIRDRVYTWAQNERTQKLAGMLPMTLLLLMGACSTQVVFAGDDGVLHTREALLTFQEKREKVLEATPDNAIIIVDRADKYLWPHRAVVVPLRSEQTYAAIPSLLEAAPLYYFSITLPEEDLRYLHEQILAGKGIVFTPMLTINEETLYEITRK